ncbi:hypothetical protein GUITHDRAFT_67323 [Guillardia theta CCMP2712]|uniref:Prolyl endopeptidase n=3 Tax=Guillardia theta TaxID=55529 RepID=L1JNJ9_GUITC|nr:hypothetical protein GUITHDRAFT_67323 [Guillardia theta CCMP2712]EKX49834.1 hypothetical protein GUITHDRAFT_67323 [Guillardia theta CCMP2712]|eukprot:XP_005836814.1 hypothetical protein GUITHDRAFT_67323 [Guillardia theta CCMP2712]
MEQFVKETNQPLFDRLMSIYESKDNIPYASKRGNFLYNFWRDEKNVRGVWRRVSVDGYKEDAPEWETLIDLDQLCKEENKSWVWRGTQVADLGGGRESERVIVKLSLGGTDAVEVREFDMRRRRFVRPEEGGFFVGSGKTYLSHVDEDTLLIGTQVGERSVTRSGYPAQIRRWRRGERLEEARVVFEVEDSSVSASSYVTRHGERRLEWRVCQKSFFSSVRYVRRMRGDSKEGGKGEEEEEEGWTMLEVPETASVSCIGSFLLVLVKDDWEVGRYKFKQGSLVAVQLESFLQEPQRSEFTLLFEPSDTTFLQGWCKTKGFLVLTLLDQVKSSLRIWKMQEQDGWVCELHQSSPDISTINVMAVEGEDEDQVWLTRSSYIEPTSLSLLHVNDLLSSKTSFFDEAFVVKRLPHMFQHRDMKVTQHFATSKDGTRVPFFLIARDLPASSSSSSSSSSSPPPPRPTILYGYGGFQVSMLPNYQADVGAAWLEQGGAYVVANIRGGGEFGPAWHRAAMREKRQRAYEDFFAVAEELVAMNVTRPELLACKGGSNGGLLVGNALTQRPDLFGAVICSVPLLDLRRYHKLLAGASWMDEYGDPDGEDWKYLKDISPYHQVSSSARYPPALFTTSTRDDRVHPGHARRMVANLLSAGHSRVHYYENIEGGHGGAADSRQRAFLNLLAYQFLYKTFEMPNTQE